MTLAGFFIRIAPAAEKLSGALALIGALMATPFRFAMANNRPGGTLIPGRQALRGCSLRWATGELLDVYRRAALSCGIPVKFAAAGRLFLRVGCHFVPVRLAGNPLGPELLTRLIIF